MKLSDWQKIKLGEVCTIEKGTINPIKNEKILFYHFSLPSYDNDKSPEEQYGSEIKSNKTIMSEGTILYNKLNVRFKRIWNINFKLSPNSVCSTEFLPIRPRKQCEQLFLYYILSSDEFTNMMLTATTGTSNSHQRISPEFLLNTEILLPPILEQKAIANTISSLDDKIEANKRIIKNLHEIVKVLYKHWFIDFDFPNEDGCPYKSSGGEMVDSELGMIPIGWELIQFSNFLKIRNEKTSDLDFPEYSVTNLGVFPRDEKFKKQLSVSKSKNKVIKKHDLVFGMSREILNWGLMRDTIGGVSSAYNVFSIDNQRIDPLYLEEFMTFRINYFMDIIKPASREGQGIDKSVLIKKHIYLPDENLFYKYKNTAESINTYINKLTKETEIITNIRDTLMPKLMSGEIRVPVEEV
ncbi:MAG: restriction endonuclease subunit S [Bacillota bacterium]|nr:restriction endonuclease subunit S [Bacillota bacterium]